MRRVFDGGVGCWSGGIVERSRDSGVRDFEEARDDAGVDSDDILKDRYLIPGDCNRWEHDGGLRSMLVRLKEKQKSRL